MSSITINGVLICSTPDTTPVRASASVTSGSSVAPSFATHRLIDGNWVPKDQAAPIVVTPKPPIGFAPQTQKSEVVTISAPVSTIRINGDQVYSSRKEVLRAIEVAAGKVLLAGTNSKAIDAIRRGRLGGRKDNLQELHQLLREYSA